MSECSTVADAGIASFPLELCGKPEYQTPIGRCCESMVSVAESCQTLPALGFLSSDVFQSRDDDSSSTGRLPIARYRRFELRVLGCF